MIVAGRKIGDGEPPFIISDLSCSHCGSKDRAMDLIAAAKEAGASAIKFQRFTPELITLDSDDPHFKIKGTPWDGWKLIDLYRKAETPKEWFPDLYAEAARLGIVALCTCDTVEDVAFIESLGVNPAYKVGSSCITNLELIEAMAKTGKPVIISTLGADDNEIAAATAAVFTSGDTPPALLHCVPYAATLENAYMSRIWELQAMSGEPIGFSDHIRTHEAGMMAVAMGASIIEKHITMGDGNGLDDEFALNRTEFKRYVSAIRRAWRTMQPPEAGDIEAYRALRPSIHAIADIAAGERLTRANVRAINPGGGLPCFRLPGLIGQTAAVAIARGTPLSEGSIA